ncbi:MAG: sigma-70 family RNA polymerase sigma factor, partial [Planctomycetota bacterium]
PLRARVGASDIVQESMIEAQRRLSDFDDRRPMPFRVWVLKLAAERLAQARIKHLVRQRRAAGREVRLPERSSMALAAHLAEHSTPSEHVMRMERNKAVAEQIGCLKESHREILVLRHMDELNYEEIGAMLEISAATARQRYVRALMRLRSLCAAAGLTSGSR